MLSLEDVFNLHQAADRVLTRNQGNGAKYAQNNHLFLLRLKLSRTLTYAGNCS